LESEEPQKVKILSTVQVELSDYNEQKTALTNADNSDLTFETTTFSLFETFLDGKYLVVGLRNEIQIYQTRNYKLT
jgi:hypothetical protein